MSIIVIVAITRHSAFPHARRSLEMHWASSRETVGDPKMGSAVGPTAGIGTGAPARATGIRPTSATRAQQIGAGPIATKESTLTSNKVCICCTPQDSRGATCWLECFCWLERAPCRKRTPRSQSTCPRIWLVTARKPSWKSDVPLPCNCSTTLRSTQVGSQSSLATSTTKFFKNVADHLMIGAVTM